MVRVFLLSMLWCALLASGAEGVRVDLWSGRDQAVAAAGQGAWQIVAEHGRILASGQDTESVNFPALKDGTSVDAELVFSTSGERIPLRIWSPQLLFGLTARFDTDRTRLQKEFLAAGMGESEDDCRVVVSDRFLLEPGKLTLVFPEDGDLPVDLGLDWSEITIGRTVKGLLGVTVDRRNPVADGDGAAGFIRVRNAATHATLILFSPDFDFTSIRHMILLSQLIKEDIK